MALNRAAAEAVVARIDERELADLALHLASVESPAGYEGPAGDAIHEWLDAEGFAPRRVGLFEDRFNVFAELPGAGGGPALAFNSHMDTLMHRDDDLVFIDAAREDYHRGREEGDRLIGNPVVNDKGPMAAFMIATKAIREAGVALAGSVYMSMVAGEIGMEPVDEFQGKRYLSKEVGARYLLNHTPQPHYCVCAEATGFRKGWVEAGKAFYKIVVHAGPSRYTPYLSRPYAAHEQPNAIIRALPLLERIEEWALDYEQRHRYECPGGTVVPRVNIGAVRSGHPWMILRSPELFHIYLDIRTVPGQDGAAIGHELREMLDSLGITGTVEQFLNRPGFEAQGIEPLSEAVDAAHAFEFNEPCGIAGEPECSMWRDHNVYNEMGIPALTYGPIGASGGGAMAVRKADLVRSARVYALTALALCGQAG
jgi:acetylornithine deacetylase/succinyl-diaminopimelate desuccinylase-like protein